MDFCDSIMIYTCAGKKGIVELRPCKNLDHNSSQKKRVSLLVFLAIWSIWKDAHHISLIDQIWLPIEKSENWYHETICDFQYYDFLTVQQLIY